MRLCITILLALVGLGKTTAQTLGGYPIGQVPFTAVKVAPNSFWGERIKAAREVTIPLAFSKCESEGRYADNEKPTYTITVNGKRVKQTVEKGYVTINRKWKEDDVVSIHLDMKPRMVEANSKVEDTEGDGKAFKVMALKHNGLTLIPYYSWNHRGAGKMDVWIKNKE